MRFARPALGTVLLALALGAWADAAEVRWEGERLTVRAKDVALRDILAEVGARTGTPIEGLQNVEGKVSVDIEKAPLAQALNRLIGQRAHTMSIMNARPPGKSGIDLQFPSREKSATHSGSTRPPRGPVVQETWYGPDGKAHTEQGGTK